VPSNFAGAVVPVLPNDMGMAVPNADATVVPLGAVTFDCGGVVVGAPPNENDIGAAALNAGGGATVVPLDAVLFGCDDVVVGAPPNENDIGATVLNADGGATVVPEPKIKIMMNKECYAYLLVNK
jgi:hypothetical protein